jgi:PIN domain nuclease of toxin-antitoxin system
MLLDTCALLWLAEEGKKFSRPVFEQIAETPLLCISAITGFEIGVKMRAGKLKLPAPAEAWLEGIWAHHGIEVISLDFEICVKSCGLPPIHADPCDRFIIATALANSLPVVTADSRFAEYGVRTLI